MGSKLLEIRDLAAGFHTENGLVRAVDGVSFDVETGRTLGVVGESGCGKTVTAMSIVDLLPKPSGEILEGSIKLEGRELRGAPLETMYDIRGNEIGVIFQEPMAALNPVHRIGRQIGETILLHRELDPQATMKEVVQLLEDVGIPDPPARFSEYPHQLSGGMRQRVMIAMALANRPRLLIADEPTTALDVTVQAQILDLMLGLQKEMGMGIILITHDLGVIAETCDDVVVMYAGRVVERGPVKTIFKNPLHAYTRGLLNSIPRLDNERKTRLKTIEGNVPPLEKMPSGCRFGARSGIAHTEEELKVRPELKEVEPGHWVEACPKCYGGGAES